jgi:hypothetical protein
MRHRSAAAFVHACPEVVALVASRDGRLSLFHDDRSKSRVVRPRHFERLID